MAEPEHALAPSSLQLLEPASANQLKAYLDSAARGLRLPQVNHSVLPILWVVDRSGALWFALEEVVDEQEHSFLYPLSRHFATPRGHVKLGHPALLADDKSARLAGEILYDPDFGEKDWVISNKSGRYGLVAGVQRQHLLAAAELFSTFGISLEVYYIEPPAQT